MKKKLHEVDLTGCQIIDQYETIAGDIILIVQREMLDGSGWDTAEIVAGFNPAALPRVTFHIPVGEQQ